MSNLPSSGARYKGSRKSVNEPPSIHAQTSQQKLDKLHQLLHLKPSIWPPFRALAEHTLLQSNSRADISEQALITATLPEVVSNTVVSFLTTYGLQLFPISKQNRTHLAAQGYRLKHFGDAGPIYLTHGIKATGTEGREFIKTQGRQADFGDEGVAFSRIGLAMQEYFKLLIELMRQADLQDEEEMDAKESAAGEGEPEAAESNNVPLTPDELVAEILAG